MSDIWLTPISLYMLLDREFGFTLDPCAFPGRLLCPKNYFESDDGLRKSWRDEVVFCNPPYSNIELWVKKAFYSSQYLSSTVVMLLPVRTSVNWFHDFILPFAELRFLRGRVRFSNSKQNPPFDSMICIFRAI